MKPPIFVFLLFFSTQGMAWGEVGHDTIARVSVRLTTKGLKNNHTFSAPFVAKELMLGHLANIPDFYWRSQSSVSAASIASNRTTHYVDLEYLLKDPTFRAIPRTIKSAKALAKANKKDLAKDVGTAYWRVEQLQNMMIESFRRAKKASVNSAAKDKKSQNIFTRHVNDALLFAGILSHFTGDLSQPQHNSSNYDAWDNQQGGLHGYFENDLVNTFDLSLDQQVFNQATKINFIDRLIKEFPNCDKNAKEMVMALSVHSYKKLSQLHALDKKYSLLEKSIHKDSQKIKAKRKPASTVAKHFKSLIIDQLAMSAAVTKWIWLDAWKKAGKPDLSKYRSYHYHSAPAFIDIDYL